jgi:hypothetical protein
MSAKAQGNKIYFLSKNKFFLIDDPYEPTPKDFMTTEYRVSVWHIS